MEVTLRDKTYTFTDDNIFFKELEDRFHLVYKFDNNYGASIIFINNSFELAIVSFDDDGDSMDIVYGNNALVDGVIGHLSIEEVSEYLIKIKNI